MSQVAKKWILTKMFVGEPKPDDFKLMEETVSFSLKPGEIVIEALYFSVDPYMRHLREIKLPTGVGETMCGEQVARVKVSNNAEYPEGSLVVAGCGWRTLTLVPDPSAPAFFFATVVRKLPDVGDLPPSLALGTLGITGLAAYFGLVEKGEVREGDVVLVNSAAGAVGHVAGQIAKIKGCTVIGSAGTNEKCDWLKELGFDHVFNYKETTVDDALKKFAPNGIDLYFDGVGGDFSYTVLQNHMKVNGRVVLCGAMTEYNKVDKMSERSVYLPIICRSLVVRGFNISMYKQRTQEGVGQLLQWVNEGKLKYRETVTQGFEHIPDAFISLFRGGPTGKAIIKV